MLDSLVKDLEILASFPPLLTYSLKQQNYTHIAHFATFRLLYNSNVYDEVVDFLRKANGLQAAEEKTKFADNFTYTNGKIVFHTRQAPERYFDSNAKCYVVTTGTCNWNAIPYTSTKVVYGSVFTTLQNLRESFLNKLELVKEVVEFLQSTKPAIEKVLVGKFLQGGGWFDHKILEYRNLRLYALAEQKVFEAFVPKDIDKSTLYFLHINQKVSSTNGTLYYVSALDTIFRVIRSYHILVPIELPTPVTLVKLDKVPLHAHKALYNFVEEIFNRLKTLLELSSSFGT